MLTIAPNMINKISLSNPFNTCLVFAVQSNEESEDILTEEYLFCLSIEEIQQITTKEEQLALSKDFKDLSESIQQKRTKISQILNRLDSQGKEHINIGTNLMGDVTSEEEQTEIIYVIDLLRYNTHLCDKYQDALILYDAMRTIAHNQVNQKRHYTQMSGILERQAENREMGLCQIKVYRDIEMLLASMDELPQEQIETN